MLVNEQKFLVTIPLVNGKRGVRICDVRVSGGNATWKQKLLKTVQLSYHKAMNFDLIYPWFEGFVESEFTSISQMNRCAIEWICRYLLIETEIVESSSIYMNQELRGVDRLIDICKIEGADEYVNAPGGRGLYNQSMLTPYALKLSFIQNELPVYSQWSSEFIPGLSILDVLMHNSKESISGMLESYSIVEG